MTGLPISGLPSVVSPTLTDLFPEVQPPTSGITYKCTLQQLLTLYQISATNFTGLNGVLQAPTAINDSFGNNIISFSSNGSTSNTSINFINGISPGAPTMMAAGTGSNLALDLSAKGGSPVNVMSQTGTTALRLVPNINSNAFGLNISVPTITAERTATYRDLSGTVAFLSDIPAGSPSALTAANDTNVILTLGGTPATALLEATSITAGWSGTLSGTRGGTGVNNGSSTITIGNNITFSGNFPFTGTLTNTTNLTFPTSGTLATTAQTVTNVDQTSSSATLSPNTRYVTDNGATLVTYTLPATASVGDTYIIVGGSSGGWKVAQNAGQTCHVGNSTTTTGVGGSIASSNQYNCMIMTCITTNTTFASYGVQGNLTIV